MLETTDYGLSVTSDHMLQHQNDPFAGRYFHSLHMFFFFTVPLRLGELSSNYMTYSDPIW
jgi:hypothetical protein